MYLIPASDLHSLLLQAQVRPEEVPVRLVHIRIAEEVLQVHPFTIGNLSVALLDVLRLWLHRNHHINIAAPEPCSVGMSDGHNRLKLGHNIRLFKHLSDCGICQILLYKRDRENEK